MKELNRINREGMTIMLVTHDMKVAAKSDRVLYIEDGTIKGEYCLGKYDSEAEARQRERCLSDWLMEMGFWEIFAVPTGKTVKWHNGRKYMTDILLVEDHEELNQLMRIFLEKDGYSVISALSGEDALACLATETVKLIILDVALPGMDGFAVCADVRKRSNTPILFLSARVDKEDKMNGFLQGADDYVEKPVDMDLLSAQGEGSDAAQL